MHEVLVNRFGGLSLPRKSVVWLTDHPDMTLDVDRGCKTTTQQQQQQTGSHESCSPLEKRQRGGITGDVPIHTSIIIPRLPNLLDAQALCSDFKANSFHVFMKVQTMISALNEQIQSIIIPCSIIIMNLQIKTLTILHSERPKLYAILAFQSAIGLM